jgi:maltose alpha-D-glucosyltransferase/alpha-amylase
MGLVHTLGLRTGELHEAFAAPTENPAFAPEPASSKEVEGWKKGIVKELGRTLKLLERRRERLPEAVQAEVDRLLELREAAEERINSFSTDEVEVVKTRHHGDYHLGQVLVVSNDFQIIDFEGEPARPLEERRAKHSPLRDVAGMLRSFNYAAESAIMDVGAGRADQIEELEEWVRLWERNVREAFLEGYAEGAREASSYPEDEEHARQLIDLFTLEKALYEIRYELDNRPDWVGIPVKGVLDLIDEAAEKETP